MSAFFNQVVSNVTVGAFASLHKVQLIEQYGRPKILYTAKGDNHALVGLRQDPSSRFDMEIPLKEALKL